MRDGGGLDPIWGRKEPSSGYVLKAEHTVVSLWVMTGKMDKGLVRAG